ncbi:MAG: LamG-like jellyroll fold domain-containing protein, partial [Pirellulales bacterium]
DRDWRLMGPQRVAVTSATRLTHAYDFDGVDDEAWTFPENRFGNHDTTFELWFKPTELPSGPARPVFEHGNTPRGVTIGLSGDQLVLAYKANPNAAQITFDLDQDNNGIDNPDFIQAVAVIDDTNDQLRLYVDGGNVQIVPLLTFNDFTSNDDLGLGRNAGQGGGGQASTNLDWDAFFNGQIGLLREYRWAFSDAEVRQNFEAMVVPEPSSGFALLLGVSLLGWWPCRGRRSPKW